MKITSARLYAALFLLCLPLMASAADDVEVKNAWVREAPPTATVLGAFMSLENHADHAVTLKKVTSPDFETVEIHRTEQHDGMAHMVAISSLEIDKHGSVELKPGGYHLMLINPKKQMMAGNEIRLMLHFSDNTMLRVSAMVKKGMGGEDHSHHMMPNMQHEEHKMDEHQDHDMQEHGDHMEHHDMDHKH